MNIESKGIQRWAEALVDPSWYSKRYQDVAARGDDPIEHFFLLGSKERRDPNAVFDTDWYFSTYLGSDSTGINALVHYARYGRRLGLRPNPLTSPSFVREHYRLPDDIDPLLFLISNAESIDYVSEWFSRKEYRRAHPDVAAVADLLPERHFIENGLAEGRMPHPDYRLERLDQQQPRAGENRHEAIVDEFTYKGVTYVVVRRRIAADIADQIFTQAAIDPDIIAAGISSVPRLRQFIATDLSARDAIDHQRLLNEANGQQDVVVLLAALRVGGAEKYAANLVRGLADAGINRTLIITTSPSSEFPDEGKVSILGPLFGCKRVAFGDNLIRRSWRPEVILALLLLSVRPKYIFVVNSEVGLRCVKQYGRALSSAARIFCTFFSESPNVVGAPYSAKYLRAILPHAFVLADNQVVLTKLQERVDGFADRFLYLPPLVEVDPGRGYKWTRRSVQSARRKRRILWMSRWEPFKATDVLVGMARKHPDALIDVYGPVPETVVANPQTPANLLFRGVCNEPTFLDPTRYEAFLFTSWFEGMPNVVLEMAALGIPIVASDVGGLRETFSGEEIELIAMTGSVAEIADRFFAATMKLGDEGPQHRARRIEQAREAVRKRHSQKVFVPALKNILASGG